MISSSFSHTIRLLRSHPIALILLFAATAQALSGALTKGLLLDLPAYLGAVQAWLQGSNPYVTEYANRQATVNFIYPPGSIWFFLPFALFPPQIASALFTLGSVVVFIISFFALLNKLLPRIPLDYRLLITALAVQTFPVKFNLGMGQVNLYVLALIIISLLIIKSKPTLSALLFSLSLSLKPFALPLTLLLITKSYNRYTFIVLLFTLLLNLSPHLPTYLTQILPQQLNSITTDPDLYNVSLNANFYRLFNASPPFNLGLVIVLPLILLVLKSKQPFLNQAIELLALATLIPSSLWTHHLVYLYPLLFTTYANPIFLIPTWFLLAYHLPSPHKDNPFHILITILQTTTLYSLTLLPLFIQKLKFSLSSLFPPPVKQ